MPQSDNNNAMKSAWPMFLRDPSHSSRSNQAGPTTLRLAWSMRIAGERSATIPVLDQSGNIFVYFHDGLYCFNEYGAPQGNSYTGISDGYCAVGPDNNIYVFGFWKVAALQWTGQRFNELWVNTTSVGQNWAPPTIGPDGTIYIVCTNSSNPGTLFHGPMDRAVAINPDGSEKWHVSTGGFSMSSPTLDAEGNVYFGCDDGNLYSVSSTGALRWSQPTNGRVSAAPVIDEKGIIYISLLKPPTGQGLVALDSSGQSLWNYPQYFTTYPAQTYDDLNPFATPTLGPDGTVYIALDDGIHAVTWDGKSKYGQARWIHLLDPGDRASYLTVDRNGSLYFTTFQQKFYALDPEGGLIWKVSPLMLQQPVIGADGTIYLAGNDTVYALSPDDAQPAALETLWDDLLNSATAEEGYEVYHLDSSTFTDPTIWPMVATAIGATILDLKSARSGSTVSAMFSGVEVSLSTPSDGLLQTDGQVILKGVGFFGGAAASLMQFVFGVSGNDVTLDFTVDPGSAWNLSGTFPALAQTFCSSLNLSQAHLSQSATTAQPASEWQFSSNVSLSGPLAPVASVVGDAGVKNLHGTITFYNDLPILDLTIGEDASSTQTFPVTLAPNLSLDITVNLTTAYQSDYESLSFQIVMNSSMSVGGHSVAVSADVLPVGGMTEFAGTYSQPPNVPLSALDIWGGDENMESIIPASMQTQSPTFALKEVGLWLLTDTKLVTAFTAKLDASNWQAIPTVTGVTNVGINLTDAELTFAAFQPFDDDQRELKSYLSGQVDINVATLAGLAKAPDFPIIGAQATLENPLSANQILTTLVAQSVPLPRGFPSAQFDTAELSAVADYGNVYYRFTTGTQWPISSCVSDLVIENLGLSIQKVHSSPTTDEFIMPVGIFGTLTIAGAVFGIGGYNPEHGSDWRFDGPVTLPVCLPSITDVVACFNNEWSSALPEVLSGLVQSYNFLYLGIITAQDWNIFSVVLTPPDGAQPWAVITQPFEIQFARTELALTCDPGIDGYVRGPFEVGEGTIYLKSSLPFSSSQYVFNIDNDPPIQNPDAEPAPVPSINDVVALVNQSWADNLPPALLDLENDIVINAFMVNVNGQNVQVNINISAADPTAAWQIIPGPPRFSLEQLRMALTDLYDGSSETASGTVMGNLPAGDSSLPMRTALTDDWSSFTVTLDADALASMESPPTISQIVALFDPDWANSLSQSILDLGSNITIDRFDLSVEPSARTASTKIQSPTNWAGWTPLSSRGDIRLSQFEIDLSYSQPGDQENPSGRLKSSITLFGETVQVVQVLPSTKLTGTLSQSVALTEIVSYLNGGTVPDYMQDVQISHIVVQIDPTTQTLTIEGNVVGDITVPRNDEDDEMGECEGEYPEPPDSVLENGRLNATSTQSATTICISGDFMWNTGIKVPGQSCYPFTDFVPSLTGDGATPITFPPPVDPTSSQSSQPPLDDLTSEARDIMGQGLTEAEAVFLLSQQQELSPQQSIQTLYELNDGNLLQLPTITTEFTDIYPGKSCDPDETTEDVVDALENLPSGPVTVTPEIMALALVAAFPGITAAAIAAALLAAGLTLPPSLPGSGDVSCSEIAADMAAAGYDPTEAARVLVTLPQCESETSTAQGLTDLLSAAYPAMTLTELASALAAVGFAATDVALALVGFAAAAGIPLSAVTLAGLLVTAFGPVFTPDELADILVVCGFPPADVVLVFTQEPPIVPGVPTTAAGLAALLVAAYGSALSCSDLADSLAETSYDLSSVTVTLHDSSVCGDETSSAEDMAELLVAAYGSTITCADLASALAAADYSADEVAPVIMENSTTLCTGQPQSAQDLADMLNAAYTDPGLTLLELAAALAAVGFAAAVVAAVISSESESDDEPGTAEDLADLLEQTYGDSLTCQMLAEALAEAGFNATETAPVLKNDADACASQTATASGMTSILLGAYPSISCQDMANALAACAYEASDVALALCNIPPCTMQRETTSELAAVLTAAYTNPPLTCDQLVGALGAVQCPVNEVAILLTQSPYDSLCGSEIRTASGMANLLVQSYPFAITCTDIGEALAGAGYGATDVAYVMSGQSCSCEYSPLNAGSMASTLNNIYKNPPLTCDQLAQALAVSGYPLDDIAQELMRPVHSSVCSQQTASAQAFAELLYNAYPAHNVSPNQITEALASVGFSANEVAPALRSLFPNSTRTAAAVAALLLPNYPDLTCSQLAAALAATPCDIIQTAQELQQQSALCVGQTQTAEEMASLLYSAFGSTLTCAILAQALASTGYPVDDIAVVLTQSSTVLCSGQPQSANDLTLLLITVYTNPPLSCSQLAGALRAAGYSATQIAVVLTQQPPVCLDQPENAAALAYLLQQTFTDPALSCTDLAAALAAIPYDPTDVAVLLRADSSACASETETAAGMATLLLGAYTTLTCQQLGEALAHSGYDPTAVALALETPPAPHQSLCSGQTNSASSMAALLQTCYAGIGISSAQMADALAACGFVITDVAPLIHQLYPGSTTLPYYMAAILLGAYPDTDCSTLANALAAVPYDPDDVANVLLQPPPPYTTLCSNQTDSAAGMAALLMTAYPSLTCQQLAEALASAQYAASDVAPVLKAQSSCGSQTATASDMASLLTAAYTNPPLTCDQLAMALGACAYPPTDVALVLKAQGACADQTQTASGMAALLLESYSALTCAQLADALAACAYDINSVAVTLKNPPNGAQLCASQTETAGGMTELLGQAYGDDLTEDQLEGALQAAGYPDSEIQNVIETLYGGATTGWPMFMNNSRHTGRGGQVAPTSNIITATLPLDLPFNGIAVDESSNLYLSGQNETNSSSVFYVLDSDMNPKGTYSDTHYSMPGYTPALDVSGQFYMTTQWVRALYLQNNTIQQKWQYPTGSTDLLVTAPLVLGSDGTVYAVFSALSGQGTTLVGLDPSNGAVRLTVTDDSGWISSPVIASDGTIYYGSADGSIHKLTTDGTATSLLLGSGSQSYVIPAIRADGVLYVLYMGTTNSGGTTGFLTALNPDLTPLWANPYEGDGPITSNSALAIAPNGNVYAGFYYLNAVTPEGTKAWSSNKVIYPSGIAVDSTGNVFFGGGLRSGFYGLDPDGKNLWANSSGSGVTAPAIGPDGSVYYSDGFGTLYKATT